MEMMKEAGKMLVEGASGTVLGLACESFLKSIEKWCTVDYPALESVKGRVNLLKEVIPKMDDCNIKLGDRQDELKQVKEEMERVTRLLKELSQVSKASLNDQLEDLDASLKSLVRRLGLQSAVDVKQVLVLEMENGEVVKSTKRKVDEMDETVKSIKRDQQLMLNTMKRSPWGYYETPVEHLVEGTAVAAKLREVDHLAADALQRWRDAANILNHARRVRARTGKIYDLVERRAPEIEELSYIPVSVLNRFTTSLGEGADLLRNLFTVTEWTDELQTAYTNQFRALEDTLDQLYSRLAAIRPFKWRCGNCNNSNGATSTSTSLMNSAGQLITL